MIIEKQMKLIHFFGYLNRNNCKFHALTNENNSLMFQEVVS